MKKQTKHRLAGIISPVAISILRLHTRITGRQRARAIICNEFGEILLVRGIVGRQWSLPGGGIEKGETPVQAAARELYEETGIIVGENNFQPVAVLKSPEIPVNYIAHIFTTTVKKADLPNYLHNGREIIEVGWFEPGVLPNDKSAIVEISLGYLSK